METPSPSKKQEKTVLGLFTQNPEISDLAIFATFPTFLGYGDKSRVPGPRSPVPIPSKFANFAISGFFINPNSLRQRNPQCIPQGNSHLKIKGLASDEGVGSTMRMTHRYDSQCLRGDDQGTVSSFDFVSKVKVGNALFSLFSLCRIY